MTVLCRESFHIRKEQRTLQTFIGFDTKFHVFDTKFIIFTHAAVLLLPGEIRSRFELPEEICCRGPLGRVLLVVG